MQEEGAIVGEEGKGADCRVDGRQCCGSCVAPTVVSPIIEEK